MADSKSVKSSGESKAAAGLPEVVARVCAAFRREMEHGEFDPSKAAKRKEAIAQSLINALRSAPVNATNVQIVVDRLFATQDVSILMKYICQLCSSESSASFQPWRELFAYMDLTLRYAKVEHSEQVAINKQKKALLTKWLESAKKGDNVSRLLFLAGLYSETVNTTFAQGYASEGDTIRFLGNILALMIKDSDDLEQWMRMILRVADNHFRIADHDRAISLSPQIIAPVIEQILSKACTAIGEIFGRRRFVEADIAFVDVGEEARQSVIAFDAVLRGYIELLLKLFSFPSASDRYLQAAASKVFIQFVDTSYSDLLLQAEAEGYFYRLMRLLSNEQKYVVLDQVVKSALEKVQQGKTQQDKIQALWFLFTQICQSEAANTEFASDREQMMALCQKVLVGFNRTNLDLLTDFLYYKLTDQAAVDQERILRQIIQILPRSYRFKTAVYSRLLKHKATQLLFTLDPEFATQFEALAQEQEHKEMTRRKSQDDLRTERLRRSLDSLSAIAQQRSATERKIMEEKEAEEQRKKDAKQREMKEQEATKQREMEEIKKAYDQKVASMIQPLDEYIAKSGRRFGEEAQKMFAHHQEMVATALKGIPILTLCLYIDVVNPQSHLSKSCMGIIDRFPRTLLSEHAERKVREYVTKDLWHRIIPFLLRHITDLRDVCMQASHSPQFMLERFAGILELELGKIITEGFKVLQSTQTVDLEKIVDDFLRAVVPVVELGLNAAVLDGEHRVQEFNRRMDAELKSDSVDAARIYAEGAVGNFRKVVSALFGSGIENLPLFSWIETLDATRAHKFPINEVVGICKKYPNTALCQSATERVCEYIAMDMWIGINAALFRKIQAFKKEHEAAAKSFEPMLVIFLGKLQKDFAGFLQEVMPGIIKQYMVNPNLSLDSIVAAVFEKYFPKQLSPSVAKESISKEDKGKFEEGIAATAKLVAETEQRIRDTFGGFAMDIKQFAAAKLAKKIGAIPGAVYARYITIIFKTSRLEDNAEIRKTVSEYLSSIAFRCLQSSIERFLDIASADAKGLRIEVLRHFWGGDDFADMLIDCAKAAFRDLNSIESFGKILTERLRLRLGDLLDEAEKEFVAPFSPELMTFLSAPNLQRHDHDVWARSLRSHHGIIPEVIDIQHALFPSYGDPSDSYYLKYAGIFKMPGADKATFPVHVDIKKYMARKIWDLMIANMIKVFGKNPSASDIKIINSIYPELMKIASDKGITTENGLTTLFENKASQAKKEALARVASPSAPVASAPQTAAEAEAEQKKKIEEEKQRQIEQQRLIEQQRMRQLMSASAPVRSEARVASVSEVKQATPQDLIETAIQNRSVSVRLDARQLKSEEIRAIIPYLQREECKVVDISFADNKFGDAGAQAVAELLRTPNNGVRAVNLEKNGIGDNGMIAVASALSDRNCAVTEVNFWGNDFGIRGTNAIVELLMTEDNRINDVNLASNNIGDAGAIAVAGALVNRNCRLVSLGLASNGIGSSGIRAIAAALQRDDCARTLTSLYLGSTRDISAEDIQILARAVNVNGRVVVYGIPDFERILAAEQQAKVAAEEKQKQLQEQVRKDEELKVARRQVNVTMAAEMVREIVAKTLVTAQPSNERMLDVTLVAKAETLAKEMEVHQERLQKCSADTEVKSMLLKAFGSRNNLLEFAGWSREDFVAGAKIYVLDSSNAKVLDSLGVPSASIISKLRVCVASSIINRAVDELLPVIEAMAKRSDAKAIISKFVSLGVIAAIKTIAEEVIHSHAGIDAFVSRIRDLFVNKVTEAEQMVLSEQATAQQAAKRT